MNTALADDVLFAQVFDDAPIGMTVVDLSNRFQRVNRRMCEITGRSADSLLGTDAALITHPPDRPRVGQMIEQMLAQGQRTAQIEKRYLHADGHLIPAVLSVSVVRDRAGQPLYFVGQVEDITVRKAQEVHVAQQARELERSNSELQQFAYAASHDLQEPLRVLTVCVEMLGQEAGEHLSEEARDLIKYAIEASQQMTALIDDLLDLARVGSDGAPTELVDLDEALDAALAQLHVLIDSEHAEIRRDGPMGAVHGRAAQLARLLQNVIANALKFRHPDRAPCVTVSARRTNGHVVLSVADNGIGIPDERQNDVFTAFRRLHRPDEYPGTGVGLSICRKIVDLHGGRIWFSSRVGEGTTFYIELPCA